MQGVTVPRKLLTRRTRIGAVLAGALVLLVAVGCGGGGGWGGGDGGGDSADLEAQAEQISTLLDQIEALPTTATSA